MINNINIRRVKANLKELFEDKIDMRDFPENQSKLNNLGLIEPSVRHG